MEGTKDAGRSKGILSVIGVLGIVTFFGGFSDGMTFVRSFTQKSSTSEGTTKSSVTSARPFCTSSVCTSTVSDAALMCAAASCFRTSARPSAAFSTKTLTCADVRSLARNWSATLSSL
jgi:hypothetical protein